MCSESASSLLSETANIESESDPIFRAEKQVCDREREGDIF